MTFTKSNEIGALDKGQLAAASSISVIEASDSALAMDATSIAISDKLDGDLKTIPATGSLSQGTLTTATAGTAIAMPPKVLKGGVLLQWVGPGNIYWGNSTVGNGSSSPFLSGDGITAIEITGLADMSSIYINSDDANAVVLWSAI